MAHGAELVTFGPQLCGPGMIRTNGECVDIERGKCPVGYYLTNIDAATYDAPSIRNNCMNSYNKVTMPDEFYAIYNGVLVKFGPKFCGADSFMESGECVKRTQGRCPDNYYKVPVNQATFSAMSVAGKQCMNSYDEFELIDIIHLEYNGVLVNFGAKLCGPGMRMMDDTCVALSRGECPSNYYDISVDDTTLEKTNMGKCENGYTSYAFSNNCASGAGGDICAVLCDAGLNYTGLGTCATACEHGATMIKTSVGLRVPLYSTPQSSPSINIGLADGVCYGNLMPGTSPGAINIKHENTTYHSTD